MTLIADVFRQSPDIALFLSLALGYWIGKFRFGMFQLGGVAGSLLAAVVISQFGASMDDGTKAVLFALFIYAVGFESGPQFFRSLGRKTIREIILSAVLAVSGLATVVILAKLFGLDKGIAAGIASGGLTQSAIIGTAGSAIEKLGLSADETQRLQADVAIGYAVTYIFGCIGPILVCVNFLPWFMGRNIRDDAVKAEAELLKGARVYGAGEAPALPDLIGRVYRVQGGAGLAISAVESSEPGAGFTVERVNRKGQNIGLDPALVLEEGDLVLVVGHRAGVVRLGERLGPEVPAADGMELVVTTRSIVITSSSLVGHTVAEMRHASAGLRHGIYMLGMSRGGEPLDLSDDTVIRAGDVLTVYGVREDLQRLEGLVGPSLNPSDKTDFVFHGFGIVIGLLAGLLVVRIGSVPLTLGSGGGALLAGLVFGWYRTRNMTRGNMPTAASTLLRDLGLAGFVAVVGLQSGQQAVQTVMQSGASIFLVGVVVTLVPLLLTLLVGRYVLRYDNVAVFAGALCGARSANPAFGELLNKAGNSVPTPSFAITYALANVFLTLLGPLVVAFV